MEAEDLGVLEDGVRDLEAQEQQEHHNVGSNATRTSASKKIQTYSVMSPPSPFL
jgi:hypothetical protein